ISKYHPTDGSISEVLLLWSAQEKRFNFLFGNENKDKIISKDKFVEGHLYHVVGSYDGQVFKLYVNGQEQGSQTLVKNINYSNSSWIIGSNPIIFQNVGHIRTWGGTIATIR